MQKTRESGAGRPFLGQRGSPRAKCQDPSPAWQGRALGEDPRWSGRFCYLGQERVSPQIARRATSTRALAQAVPSALPRAVSPAQDHMVGSEDSAPGFLTPSSVPLEPCPSTSRTGQHGQRHHRARTPWLGPEPALGGWRGLGSASARASQPAIGIQPAAGPFPALLAIV